MDNVHIILRCNKGVFEVLKPEVDQEHGNVYQCENYEQAFKLALELSSKLGVPVRNEDIVCYIPPNT